MKIGNSVVCIKKQKKQYKRFFSSLPQVGEIYTISAFDYRYNPDKIGLAFAEIKQHRDFKMRLWYFEAEDFIVVKLPKETVDDKGGSMKEFNEEELFKVYWNFYHSAVELIEEYKTNDRVTGDYILGKLSAISRESEDDLIIIAFGFILENRQ